LVGCDDGVSLTDVIVSTFVTASASSLSFACGGIFFFILAIVVVAFFRLFVIWLGLVGKFGLLFESVVNVEVLG